MRKYIFVIVTLAFASSTWGITFDDLREKAAKDPNIHGRIVCVAEQKWCPDESSPIHDSKECPPGYFRKEEYIFDGAANRFKLIITDFQDANYSRVMFGKAGWCLQFYPNRDNKYEMYLSDGGDPLNVCDLLWVRGANKLQIESADLEYIPDANELTPFILKNTIIEYVVEDNPADKIYSVYMKIRQNKLMDIDEVIALAEEAKELYKEKHGK